MNHEVYPLSPIAVRAADNGNIVEAVKVLRKETGLSLKEAKDLVDSYIKNKGKPSFATQRHLEMPSAAVAALHNGKLVQAIKQFRQRNDMGLKDAKEAVEKYLEQNPATGKRFREASARERNRIMKIGFLLLGLLATSYFFAKGQIF